MKKITEILFVLLLCIFVWQGVNRIKDGGNEKTTVYEGIPEEGKNDDRGNDNRRNRRFSFYMSRGKTNDICYISYHTEIRKGGVGNRSDQKITVVRIIRK